MSAIALFVLMPVSALAGLCDVAAPRNRWLRRPKDTYWDYLKQHGREVVEYEWSGYVLATLLPYLNEHHQMNLMTSEYDELSMDLTDKRGATHFVFTEAHKREYRAKFDPQSFSEQALRDYYNEFNEVDEPEAGRWMLDGIRAIQRSLEQVDAASVIVFIIA